MRRAAILAMGVAGLGLFGTGVHGLTQVDGQLASAAKRPAVHNVRQDLGAPGDCPRRLGPERQRL